MKKILLFIFSILALCACHPVNTEDVSVSNKASVPVQSMPEAMPEDFGFSVQFGIGKKNEINTFTGQVIKDLIEDGTATVDLPLLDKEMSEIYRKMKAINIFTEKEFVPSPVNGTMCVQQPHEEDEWKITIDGETISHSISGEYCEPTQDAKQFLELRNYVFSKVKQREEYLELPESRGGYD